MKKFLFSVFLLLLLAVIGALFVLPYGLGFVAQNKYTQILDMLTKSNAVQITLMDYQRGWFSSEATVKVEMPVSLSAPGVDTLIVKQHIEHGPIFSLTSKTGEKHLALGQTLITTQVNSTLGAVEIVSRIKLNGALVGAISALKLRYENPEGKHSIVEFNNLSGTFKLSADLKKFMANLQIPQMMIEADQFSQQTNQMKLTYDLKKSDSGLFLGQRTLTIDAMTWNADFIPNKALKLQGLKIDGRDEEQDHKVNSQIDAELKHLVVNNANYGPQRIVLAVNHVDVPALLALRKGVNSLHKSQVSTEERLTKYQQLLAGLLSKGLEIQVKRLEMVTPWGAPSLTANLTVAAQPISDLAGLMNATNIVAEINVPATFLVRALEKIDVITQNPIMADTTGAASGIPSSNPTHTAQQRITDWINKKWLLPYGRGYKSIIIYQKQQITINAQPLNMPSAVPSFSPSTPTVPVQTPFDPNMS